MIRDRLYARHLPAGFGLDSITSLGLTEWDDVNAILTEMQKKGIEVALLERH